MKYDVRRTEGLRHVIYIFLGSYLGKVKNFPRVLFSSCIPSVSSLEKTHPG